MYFLLSHTDRQRNAGSAFKHNHIKSNFPILLCVPRGVFFGFWFFPSLHLLNFVDMYFWSSPRYVKKFNQYAIRQIRGNGTCTALSLISRGQTTHLILLAQFLFTDITHSPQTQFKWWCVLCAFSILNAPVYVPGFCFFWVILTLSYIDWKANRPSTFFTFAQAGVLHLVSFYYSHLFFWVVLPKLGKLYKNNLHHVNYKTTMKPKCLILVDNPLGWSCRGGFVRLTERTAGQNTCLQARVRSSTSAPSNTSAFLFLTDLQRKS